jgi:glycosyltransferase involved in cell wall biosynthesis
VSATVLLVSKPVVPPWNDSSKNLVKDLALAGARYRYRVLTTPGFQFGSPHVTEEPIYRQAGSFSPGVEQNLRVLLRLLRHDDTAVTHFFFAPNARAAAAARAALALRRRRTIQTVCSTPASFESPERVLFAEHVVVLSRHTQRRFTEVGFDPRRLTFIPPGITIPPLPTAAERRAARIRHGLPTEGLVVIYPGDYQFSSAADTFARALPLLADLPVTFVFACRIKGAASIDAEGRVRSMIADANLVGRVRMMRAVSDMLGLLAACDLCALPAEQLYAKMDLPLVLLEALALGVPLVLADRPPLCEVLDGDVGVAVPPLAPEALAAALRALLVDEPRRRQLAQNARAAACARYAITEVARRHEDLYQQLIEG